MMRIAPIAVAALLTIAGAGAARADEPSVVIEPPSDDGPPLATPIVPVAREAAPARLWYGWQVLASDAASLVATVGCAASSLNEDACYVPLAGYVVGGPIIHAVHGNIWRSLPSVALRVGLPFAGAWIGARLADCPRDNGDLFCGLSEIGAGILLGTAAAIVIDSAWAFEDLPAPPRPRRTASVSPTLTFNRGATVVGLGGRF